MATGKNHYKMMEDVEEYPPEPTDKSDEESSKIQRPNIRSALDLQRLKLEKLMKNPTKEIIIPELHKEKDYLQSVPSFVRNVMGSSAGAGSGEFHVYRHLRRKEYARQKYIKSKSIREQLDDDYRDKLERNKTTAEEKTAKKRAKRQKKKQKQKQHGKKPKMQEELPNNEDFSSDDSESNEDDQTENTNNQTKCEKIKEIDEISKKSDCNIHENDNNKPIEEESSAVDQSTEQQSDISKEEQENIENTNVKESENDKICKVLKPTIENIEKPEEKIEKPEENAEKPEENIEKPEEEICTQ